MMSGVERRIRSVVRNDNCSGCGACASRVPGLQMGYSDQGFLRPVLGTARDIPPRSSLDSRLRTDFEQYCPGFRVRARVEEHSHETFGPYYSAWQGYAADGDQREAGSSGGVLTALNAWLLSEGAASTVIATKPDRAVPTRSVAVRIVSRDEALGTAGSRYAPSANAALLPKKLDASTIFTGKPCEASAARSIGAQEVTAVDDRPLILSFFCAGTPSQLATDDLSKSLGMPPESVASLRYRGDGWPGFFKVVSRAGTQARLTYEESWGKHLGRRLQWRCKICVDGTGADADISVGDFWDADDRGFPLFSEGLGNSAIIARTPRGHDLLMRARKDGVVVIKEVDLDEVARIQPLQVRRVRELIPRLVGRMLSGKTVPRYQGHNLWRRRARGGASMLRVAAGTAMRSISR